MLILFINWAIILFVRLIWFVSYELIWDFNLRYIWICVSQIYHFTVHPNLKINSIIVQVSCKSLEKNVLKTCKFPKYCQLGVVVYLPPGALLLVGSPRAPIGRLETESAVSFSHSLHPVIQTHHRVCILNKPSVFKFKKE